MKLKIKRNLNHTSKKKNKKIKKVSNLTTYQGLK